MESTTQPAVYTNPYTGKPRDPRDIASDPAGLLMVPAGKPHYASRKNDEQYS